MKSLETLRKQEMIPMPDWGADYLKAFDQGGGSHSKGLKVMGLSWDQVFLARQKCEAFDKAISQIKERWREINLNELERISMEQAMKPGCITERIFRMKQLDPSYRDKQGISSGGIRIVLGFDMHPGGKRKELEITANAKIGDAVTDEGFDKMIKDGDL